MHSIGLQAIEVFIFGMKRQISLLITLTTGLLLLACTTNLTTPITDLDSSAIQTQAVSTFASSLTETLVAIPIASPTLTSLPSFTPLAVTETNVAENPQNSCYKLLFIKDITIADGTHLKDNEVFTKTWLVQNNGACAWAPGFTFSHVGGDSMRGKMFVLTDPIPVGAKRELSIEMVAPSGQNGLVQSSWQMADASGNFFGDTLTVNITVGNIFTATATP